MKILGNLIDYIAWRGDIPRSAMPFNEVDWMIFARLAYAPFSYLYLDEENRYLTVEELMRIIREREDVHEYVLRKLDFSLYEMLENCERYKDITIGNYIDLHEEEKNLQFCAYTLKIPDGPIGVIFRGTDDTMVGWKENMNMAFQCPVEAQKMAARYFNLLVEETDREEADIINPVDYREVMRNIIMDAENQDLMRLTYGSPVNPMTDRQFVLAGHSKGGNLAAYAASFCKYEYQDRILNVYNYDGPGFDEMVLVTPQYQNICKRIHTYVPQSSMVGILLGHMEDHMVVHSTDNMGGVGQHNMYTWEIERNHFVEAEGGTSAGSRAFDRTLRDWLAGMDKQTREHFVESLFELMEELDVHTVGDLKKHWWALSKAIFSVMKNKDDEDKRVLQEGLAILAKSAKNNLFPANPKKQKKQENQEEQTAEEKYAELDGSSEQFLIQQQLNEQVLQEEKNDADLTAEKEENIFVDESERK